MVEDGEDEAFGVTTGPSKSADGSTVPPNSSCTGGDVAAVGVVPDEDAGGRDKPGVGADFGSRWPETMLLSRGGCVLAGLITGNKCLS